MIVLFETLATDKLSGCVESVPPRRPLLHMLERFMSPKFRMTRGFLHYEETVSVRSK